MEFTVTECTEVVLNGKRVLLEKGDKIIINEITETGELTPEDEYYLSDTNAPQELDSEALNDYRERVNLSKKVKNLNTLGVSYDNEGYVSTNMEANFEGDSHAYVQKFKVRGIPNDASEVKVLETEYGDILTAWCDYHVDVGNRNFRRVTTVYWWNPKSRMWVDMYNWGDMLSPEQEDYIKEKEKEYVLPEWTH